MRRAGAGNPGQTVLRKLAAPWLAIEYRIAIIGSSGAVRKWFRGNNAERKGYHARASGVWSCPLIQLS